MYPRDALALQAGHLVDFRTGRTRMLRDRIARAMRAWTPHMPGWHALLGMHAFGLVHTGDARAAEIVGYRANRLEPRNGWAVSAVANALATGARWGDGIAWLRSRGEALAANEAFRTRGWWHLALCHLELDEIDEALAVYDERIGCIGKPAVLDLVDASSLLWRLHLRGVDVGARWQGLARHWVPLAGIMAWSFDDVHAAMAFVGAGRAGELRTVLETQERMLPGAATSRRVGTRITHAIAAFGEGNWREATDLLRRARDDVDRCGGSGLQRDVVDLTLIEAAQRAGARRFAAALRSERFVGNPGGGRGDEH